MAELGEAGPAEHKRIAVLARDLGIGVIAVHAAEYGVPVVNGVDGALAALQLEEGDAVLVKGSRVVGLEVLASALFVRTPPTISVPMAVTWSQLELPFAATCAVLVHVVFDVCPLCDGDLIPEHAHHRCTHCGWRDSCCD